MNFCLEWKMWLRICTAIRPLVSILFSASFPIMMSAFIVHQTTFDMFERRMRLSVIRFPHFCRGCVNCFDDFHAKWFKGEEKLTEGCFRLFDLFMARMYKKNVFGGDIMYFSNNGRILQITRREKRNPKHEKHLMYKILAELCALHKR